MAALTVTMVGSLSLAATPAQALKRHAFALSITGSGTNTLSGPIDVAIDQSSHDVYVTDPANHRVEKFDSAGNFILMFGKGVDHTTGGDVCTAASGDTCQAGSSGSAAGQFTTPNFVAVDSSNGASTGDVYVGDTGDDLVSKFDSSGNLIASWGSGGHLDGSTASDGPFGPSFGGIAVDSGGNLFAINNHWGIFEFAQDGSFVHDFTFGPAVAPVGLAVNSVDYLYFAGPDGTVHKFDNRANNLGAVTNGNISGLAIDPSSQDLYVDEGNLIEHFTASCNPSAGPCPIADSFGSGNLNGAQGLGVDAASGALYAADAGNHRIAVFTLIPFLPDVTIDPISNPTPTSVTLNGHIDPAAAGNVTGCHFDYGTDTSYGSGSLPCLDPGNATVGTLANPITAPTDVHADISGLTAETTYYYRLVAANSNGNNLATATVTPHVVAGLSTDPATNIGGTSATLNGSFVGNGTDTHYYFQWGTNTSYGNTTAVPPGVDVGSPTGPSRTTLPPVTLQNLNPVTTYFYRVVASNSAGTSYGDPQSFTTLPLLPLVKESVSDVHSDSAVLHAQINPGSGDTRYHFEFGTSDCSAMPDPCTSVPVPDIGIGNGTAYIAVSHSLSGLTAGTTYHWRVVATNLAGSGGSDRTFATFPFNPVLSDPCPNAHVRQQTSAALLPDCRAYELVSAANTGGNDVESNLIAGQTPFAGYPQASNPSRALYAVHFGSIPGVGDSTNHGPDPYLATRTSNGWNTSYVGIPANGTPSTSPFASTLAEGDPILDTFAFGGNGICSPCFADGSSGIPIHMPDGSLVQGMAGSIPQPAAAPDGLIVKHFSPDGTHFVFGSTSQFEPDGNNNTGDVSIYDRNLNTGITHVVSKNPAGVNLPCLPVAGKCSSPGDANGIAELDISNDGSRIIVAQKVSTDAAGNAYFHPYMNIGDSGQTVDLAPLATDGVLYDGMTADGSKVFFTTKDQLLPALDTDSSADIYEADVAKDGTVTLKLISTGSGNTGNTDSCNPVSNSARTHWNSAGAAANCDAVAIGGAGGIGTADGTVYFLSPEKLDGASSGTQDQPNLYLARPGSAPHYITTLEPNNLVVLDAIGAVGTRKTADFQVTPSGNDAAFTSTLALTPAVDNAGHSEVYRYDTSSDQLDCASCAPTGAQATGNATLASNGLSISDDGRVFFDSTDPLAARDLDQKTDVYEWEAQGTQASGAQSCQTPGGCLGLISTGTSPFDSALLSVSADGIDAYFFTHDSLVPQDQNGSLTKLYDARATGGFLFIPRPVPCQASDECHGPSSQAAPPPNIGTFKGSRGNVVSTPKKKHKHRPHKRHHKRHHKRGGGK